MTQRSTNHTGAHANVHTTLMTAAFYQDRCADRSDKDQMADVLTRRLSFERDWSCRYNSMSRCRFNF